MTNLKAAPTRVLDKRAFFRNVSYQPHEKQWLFHNSRARFRVPVCGRRFGKSQMSAMDMLPELFLPDRRYWIVGPTYELGEREFRVVWNTLQQHGLLRQGTGIHGVYNKPGGKMWIKFDHWNTLLEVRSAEKPETLVGDGLHGVIMSEAAKHSPTTWTQYIRPALADFNGWATFPTTPEGQNWLYEVWRLGQHPDEREYDSWQFPSWDNPYVYPLGRIDPEILSIERETPPSIFGQEYGASFASFAGKIYPEFDEKIHVRPVRFNPDWPNYITWDFGFTNPLAAIEFQVDPMDRVWVWREHYQAGLTLPSHVEMMKQRWQPDDYRIDLMFGDSADPEAIAHLNQHMAPTVGDPLSKSNWRQGIGVVKSFLQPRDANAPAGTPGALPSLFIDNGCGNTIREHMAYRSAPPGARSDLDPREQAKKSSDHTCDSLRYGLMHVFVLGYKATGAASVLLQAVQHASGQANPAEMAVLAAAIESQGNIYTDTVLTAEGIRF